MFYTLRCIALATAIFLLPSINSSNVDADLIDFLAIHGESDPAPQTVINSTDNSGAIDRNENTNRKLNNLLDEVGLSGPPFVQASLGTPLPWQCYYNSQPIDPRGNLGILIDLGRIHRIDAMQLYGYNTNDLGGAFTERTPANFTIWTASSDSAVKYELNANDDLVILVDDISMFSQHGMNFGMSDPGAVPTTGETYLFSGADQPPEVSDSEPDVVTEEVVFARYIFLRDLEPIETDPADLNIVGLAEIQFYGFSLGDVNVDGAIDFLDIDPFVQLLLAQEYNVFADVNFDGSLDFLDIQPFVDLLD